MGVDSRLKVVLLWHMHQPEYRDIACCHYQLPWTYLHAMKDYVDMAAILEQAPDARAVVNFAPILLEQISDYAMQVEGFLAGNQAIHDPLLASLDMPTLPVSEEERISLIKACLKANEDRLIDRFPPYRSLANIAAVIINDRKAVSYFDEQYLVDLVVWYHLAWLGETIRRENKHVQHLMEKGRDFTLQDRRCLLEVIGGILKGLLGRYRALAERGQVELSVTPYSHPMLPLMIDFNTASEAIPEVRLPQTKAYPEGIERANWHIRKGFEVFKQHFGFIPQGCWPSEGGVSTALAHLLGEHGVKWIASGENVLRNSLTQHMASDGVSVESGFHQAYQIAEKGPACFFRDDGLSDLIGFTYSQWHGDDAVNNFIHHLENIAGAHKDDPSRVVSVILDGENAWEYYPENGYHFLTALYKKLSTHPRLKLTTFSDCIDSGIEVKNLSGLVAGSWVHGTFSTWIGDPDKNRGWDLLCDAKLAYDKVVKSGKLKGEKRLLAEQQLAVCEGSDWFWWFGDYNPSETVRDFERLYRIHLFNLYQMIGIEPPETLTEVISLGSGKPVQGGVMRTGNA